MMTLKALSKHFSNTCKTIATLAFAVACIAPLKGREDTKANYQLSPGDTLQMSILQEPDMKTEVRVSIDGTIQLPLVGEVQVAGKSLPELRKELYTAYDSKYLVRPQIALNIKEYAQRRVRVRGEVNKPGFVLIPPEENFTLIDVITAAGDITPSGNERKVELRRFDRDGSSSTQTIDLSQLDRYPELSQSYLKDGDEVIVPEKLF
ncbi:polysaccharide biosynthesis/export family protein [Pelagicoccus albus]|uniref:Polysaccharide export protein n=1 Tax=Pelagicoccus albus TaxID=415222 RepID=A0A7X1B5Y4_9BACT|nr:polysaccharide biosynthesis/export family protein [Pelagicoccus albus]MBC2606263.1 polysaccharide export protein [Pelagicoccus albus]